MERISKAMKQAAADRFRFYLYLFLALSVLFLIMGLISGTFIWMLGAAATGILLVITGLLMLHWRKKIDQFLAETPLREPVRQADATFFTQDEILSYSLDRLCRCRYDQIERVYHNRNIWEKTRPGYHGNHSVTIVSDNGIMLVRVRDALQAEMIVSFIESRAFNKGTVSLEEIGNWTVKERF